MAIDEVPFSSFPDDFWKRGRKRTQGDPNHDILYLAVGRALSEWEMLENQLATLFSIFLENQGAAPRRAYGCIVSGATRTTLLREVANGFFSTHGGQKDDMDSTSQILKNYSNAAGRRNEIAHGVVCRFIFEQKDYGCLLVSSGYNSSKTDAKSYWETPNVRTLSIYAYNSSDINTFADKCSQMSAKTASHNSYLFKKYIWSSLPLTAPSQ